MRERLQRGVDEGRAIWRRRLPNLRFELKLIGVLAVVTFVAIVIGDALGLL